MYARIYVGATVIYPPDTPATLRVRIFPRSVVYATLMPEPSRGADMPETLSDALIAEMVRRRITQAQAAELCGATQQTFSKWVNGLHVPHDERLPAIAAFLGLSSDDLAALLPAPESGARQSSKQKVTQVEARQERLVLRFEALGLRLDAIEQRLASVERRLEAGPPRH